MRVKKADLANAAFSITVIIPGKSRHSLINSADKFCSGAHKPGQGTQRSSTCRDTETREIQKVMRYAKQ